jgi:hypothetical protein
VIAFPMCDDVGWAHAFISGAIASWERAIPARKGGLDDVDPNIKKYKKHQW